MSCCIRAPPRYFGQDPVVITHLLTTLERDTPPRYLSLCLFCLSLTRKYHAIFSTMADVVTADKLKCVRSDGEVADVRVGVRVAVLLPLLGVIPMRAALRAVQCR